MGNDWFHEYFINELKAIGRKPTSNMQHEVVDSLPSSGNEQTIYFVKNDSSSNNDHYDEYVWISSSSTFEKIGSAQIDGSATQPDWNQNDDTQPDYVKNRPFYTGAPVETILIEETTIPFEDSGEGAYVARPNLTFTPIVGETYKVTWDGTVYESVCLNFREVITIGNISIMGAGSNTGEPFLMLIENGHFTIGTTDTSASHIVSINKTIVPVVKIDPKYLDQSDWNQNDKTASSYIKNRPFYTDYTEEKTLIKESPVNFRESSGHYSGSLRSTFTPIVGETYKVSWDGTVYESVCLNVQGKITIGNMSIRGAGSNTGEPFFIAVGDRTYIYTLDTSSSHTISIGGRTAQVVKIDEKYLPDTVATKSDVEVVQTAATNAQNMANNAQTTANNAQTTANNALERVVEPYTRNMQMAPLYKNGGFSAWREVVQIILYDKTEGYFFADAFDTTALKREDMPRGIFCVRVYVGSRSATALLSCAITTNNYWYVDGFAVITDKGSQTGEILHVSSNSISSGSAKGLFLTFRAPSSMLLKSSTANSDKQFRITVDNNSSLKVVNTSDSSEVTIAKASDIPTDIPTDDHIKELINTALNAIGIAEEGAY